MKIEIKSITLQNFKKERYKTLSFAHSVLISGGNETGKTTIYDAYLWCLFGVTSRPDTIVQTLDCNNNIIHKLETSVVVVINYNDERDIKIERRLTERWKGKDTADEKFMGTTQSRLVDDVPYSVSQFKEKLNSLCNFEDWFMLSNISLFWTYKVDVRRKILMSLACDINEEELMQDYPLVYKGVYTEKKEIAEMLTQQKTTRKKANDELQLIPAKVQAQDTLKVNEDFDMLESEKVAVDAQIANIEANLQGVVTESLEMQEYKKRIAEQETKNQTAHKAWTKAHFAEVDSIFKQVSEASEALRTATASQKTNLDANIQNKAKLATLTNEFNDLMQQWKDVNEKEFSYAKTDICPVCGRPYTDEMKEQEYANAVSEYNTNKASKLMEIQNKATEKHGQITVIKGCINTYEQVTANTDKKDVATKQETYNALVRKRSEIQTQTWETSAEYAETIKR